MRRRRQLGCRGFCRKLVFPVEMTGLHCGADIDSVDELLGYMSSRSK